MRNESGLNKTVMVSGLTNQEFLERYAHAGRIGLCQGATLIDRVICRAQQRLDTEGTAGSWSHVFLFQGQRADGHHWVIESDLQIHRKHFQFGVQENRISKYFDQDLFQSLAVLDFDLNAEQVSTMLREAVALSADRARYSLRELLGTLLALRHSRLRNRQNLLAREKSMYCSAFVQWVFRKAGLDLAPGLDYKNTTPKDIACTILPHVAYRLERTAPLRSGHLRRRKVQDK